MPRLYSDTDGTLVFGATANYGLVRAIDSFLTKHPGWSLIVWSHAGVDHARRWADKLFSDATVRAKDFTVVAPTDVVIDNMVLPFGVLPRAFINAVDAGKEPKRANAYPSLLRHWTAVMNNGRK